MTDYEKSIAEEQSKGDRVWEDEAQGVTVAV